MKIESIKLFYFSVQLNVCTAYCSIDIKPTIDHVSRSVSRNWCYDYCYCLTQAVKWLDFFLVHNVIEFSSDEEIHRRVGPALSIHLLPQTGRQSSYSLYNVEELILLENLAIYVFNLRKRKVHLHIQIYYWYDTSLFIKKRGREDKTAQQLDYALHCTTNIHFRTVTNALH